MEVYIGNCYNKRKIKSYIKKIPAEYLEKIDSAHFYNRSPYSTLKTSQWKHVDGYIMGAYTPKHKTIEIFCKGIPTNRVIEIFSHEVGHAVCGASERAAENFGQLLKKYIEAC